MIDLDEILKFLPLLQLVFIPALSKIWKMDNRLVRVETVLNTIRGKRHVDHNEDES